MRATDKSPRRMRASDAATSAAQPPASSPPRHNATRLYETLVQLVPDALVVTDATGCIRLVNHQAEELFGYTPGELQGQSVELLIPEGLQAAQPQHDTPSSTAHSLRPVSAELPFIGRRRDGSEFPILVSLTPVADAVGAPFVISSIRDISEMVRLQTAWVSAEAARAEAEAARAQAEVASRELQQLQAVTDSALAHLTLEDLLCELLARLHTMLAVDDVAILLLEEDGRHLLLRAAHGSTATEVGRLRIPLGQGITGRIAETRSCMVVDDLASVELAYPAIREVYHSALGVPMLVEDRLVGVVCANSTTPRHFTEVEGHLLQKAADRMALAIDRAQLYQSEQQARDQLAERVAELEAVMEAVPDAMTVYDTAGHIRLANAAHQKQTARFLLPTVPGQTIRQQYQHVGGAYAASGAMLEEAEWPQTRALRGEVLTGAKAAEVSVRTPQDELATFSVTGAPLRDADGRITGAVTVNRDITEQKRLAQEQEETRARELALEDTARHMDEFLATASHDLRTPLTVVRSRLQMALRRLTRLHGSAATPPEVLPETDIEALHASVLAANQSADRLIRLVALLFDVARARSGTLELQLAPCDLAALVREQVVTQRIAAPDRTIDLVLPNTQFVRVRADADRLGQVLTNYLSNALKYSPANQPVTVQLEILETQAVVSVTDYGPGLPVEEQSHIWEWFHRVPGIEVKYESGESSGSLGLGLHICKQLVELHPDGRVGVESVVGQGSTFWFRLPLAHTTPLAALQPADPTCADAGLESERASGE
jgi:PAS domain S-box-containing protein